jgi:hypothetical protein
MTEQFCLPVRFHTSTVAVSPHQPLAALPLSEDELEDCVVAPVAWGWPWRKARDIHVPKYMCIIHWCTSTEQEAKCGHHEHDADCCWVLLREEYLYSPAWSCVLLHAHRTATVAQHASSEAGNFASDRMNQQARDRWAESTEAQHFLCNTPATSLSPCLTTSCASFSWAMAAASTPSPGNWLSRRL